MRKTILSMMIVGVCALLAFSIALAASYDGAIWTGKPNVLGIGYYCTAAQNKSGGDTSTHWAQAKRGDLQVEILRRVLNGVIHAL